MGNIFGAVVVILTVSLTRSQVISPPPNKTNLLLALPPFLTTNENSSTSQPSFIPGIATGPYIFKVYNSLLPQMNFQLTKDGLSFSGCNSINIPCVATADGKFNVNGQSTSTLRYCPTDYDRFYLFAIAYANGYVVEANNFYLTKNGNKIVDFVKPSDSNNSPKVPSIQSLYPIPGLTPISYLSSLTPSVKPVIFTTTSSIYWQGKFILQILNAASTSIQCAFDQEQIVFQGCNIITIPYDAHLDGYFSAKTAVLLTKKQCNNSNDNVFINALKNVDKFETYSNGIYLIQKGVKIAQFKVLVESAIKVITPIQAYYNKAGAIYTAPPQGIVKPILKLPLVLLDYNSLSIQGGVDFLKGNFSLRVNVIPNFIPISIEFTDKYLTFEGCNKVSILYEARNDGYFRIGMPIFLTSRQCLLNKDDDIIAAFASADKVQKINKTVYFERAGDKILEFSRY